jgi:hypothetical protein
MKNCNDTIEPATFRLVAHSLKQLRHRHSVHCCRLISLQNQKISRHIHVPYIKGVLKKNRTFAIKTSLLILQHFNIVSFTVVPSTGDTSFPTFLPLLDCFLEHTFCDGAQFSLHFLEMPTSSATSRTVKRRFPRITVKTLSTWSSFVYLEGRLGLKSSPTDILPSLKR